MKIMRRIIKMLLLIAATLLPWMAYFFYSMTTAHDRMAATCQAIKPGMSVQALKAYAADHNLGPRHFTEKTPLVYLAEARSFGRYACRVELGNGQVIHSTSHFAD